MSPAPSEFAPLGAIKLVAGGEPITPRKPLPEGLKFKPVFRVRFDGEPSERWDGEKWVPWDWLNDRALGA